MLSQLDLRRKAGGALTEALPRPAVVKDLPVAQVRRIVERVRSEGDAALLALTAELDHVHLQELSVPAAERRAALHRIGPGLRLALETAAAAIEDYHRHTVAPVAPYHRDGVTVIELRRPIDRAGCYVPGGRARYPSTVLMTAIPARVAGVPEIALCVPPGPDGRVDDSVLAAAELAGVQDLHPVGGAQAIAAMAYGTESIRPVDVVVGPGNVYVSVAKREVAGIVGVPSAFAGPSEVVVIADDTTDPHLAALDLVVQAEHGPDGLAWLITWSETTARAVRDEVAAVVSTSPRGDEIRATLSEGGYAVLVDGPEAALQVSNAIAPEHLELLCDGAERLVAELPRAGAVFCGPWAPASVGDYLAGPSHVLPTFGSARFASALGVDDFVTKVHVISLDAEGLAGAAAHVATLARAEGLEAHALSVERRLARGGADLPAGARRDPAGPEPEPLPDERSGPAQPRPPGGLRR